MTYANFGIPPRVPPGAPNRLIYVCIPVHDEARTVGVLLWKIRKVMAELQRDYEVHVHDDASSDDTAATLGRYRKVLPLTVTRSDERIGYARATERLLRAVVKRAAYPKRDVAVTLQADFTDDPANLAALVKTIEGGADIVAGCVGKEGLGARPVPRPVWWARTLAPWALGSLHRRAPVSDPLGGFRAYRVIVLKKVLREESSAPLLSTDGWTANVELLGLVAPHARRIEETALTPRYDLQVRPTRVRALPVLKDLFRVRGRRWFVEQPASREAT
jgi:glycosyltransferase involved in cell wall biosynthesis